MLQERYNGIHRKSFSLILNCMHRMKYWNMGRDLFVLAIVNNTNLYPLEFTFEAEYLGVLLIS